MAVKHKFLRMVILFLSVIVILSCSLVGSPAGEQPDASAVETGIAIGVHVHQPCQPATDPGGNTGTDDLAGACGGANPNKPAAPSAHSGCSTLPGTQQN